MRMLDLFCKAGGCSEGYRRAGFDDITGVDHVPQPHYPFKFIQADALEYLKGHGNEYPFIHASPPCQAYTWGTRKGRENKFPMLLEPTRELLVSLGVLYVIENVVGAPLKSPMCLCGEMFGLRVLRHRLFESNVLLSQPDHPKHKPPIHPGKSWYCCVAGHGGDSWSFKHQDWCEAMGINWMTKEELIEAIPPAYTEYIGKQILSFCS